MQCIMQSGRGPYTDITGVTLEQFSKKTGVRVKVLHKIDTRFANQQLYRNGSLPELCRAIPQASVGGPYEALCRARFSRVLKTTSTSFSARQHPQRTPEYASGVGSPAA